MSSSEIVKKIFDILNKPCSFEENTEMKRATDDVDIINKLSLRLEGEHFTHSIKEFLSERNKSEIIYYRNFTDYLKIKGGLNPHKIPDPYGYVVIRNEKGKDLSHIIKLNELLQKNDSGTLSIFDLPYNFHIGQKGSGKTITQNVWLYRNHKLFEENNIFWVRLDASKLIDLWGKSESLDNPNLITIENYLLGQLVYVFSKHFQKQFVDYSDLFVSIADKLSQSPENDISHQKDFTKSEIKKYDSDGVAFEKLANDKHIDTILDYLKYLEEKISVYEGTYKKSGNERLSSTKKIYTNKSFLVDKVLLEYQTHPTNSFIEWMTIGSKLRDFLIENGYYILYIIDGIDNINYYFKQKLNYIGRIINYLFDFPLKISHSSVSKNELILVTLRDSTYQEIRRTYGNDKYTSSVFTWKDIDNFNIIRQEVSGLGKLIMSRRYEYFIKENPKGNNNCYLKKVIETINNNNSNPDEKRWNSNIRCMLYNNINLALYITFKYYLLGKPDDFNIEKQIETYQEINLYLNGRLFIWERNTNFSGNKGDNYFNIFMYVNENNKPLYLIYTYLLQLIENEPNITYFRIKEILALFNFTNNELQYCIDRLVSSGMIEQEYLPNDNIMQYKITFKGMSFKKIFINDIHYLYHSCLDILLPRELVCSFRISPHYTEKNEKRNYPPFSIITGILFLRFLLQQNNKDISDKVLETKLRQWGVSLSIFKLPIEKEYLSKSIETMIHKCQKEKDYLEILEKWLEEQNGK